MPKPKHSRNELLLVLADFLGSESYSEYKFNSSLNPEYSNSPLFQDAVNLWDKFNTAKYLIYASAICSHYKKRQLGIFSHVNLSYLHTNGDTKNVNFVDSLKIPHKREVRVLIARLMESGDNTIAKFYRTDEEAFGIWYQMILAMITEGWKDNPSKPSSDYLHPLKTILGDNAFDAVFSDLWSKWFHTIPTHPDLFHFSSKRFNETLPTKTLETLTEFSEFSAEDVIKRFIKNFYEYQMCEVIDVLKYDEVSPPENGKPLNFIHKEWNVEDSKQSWPEDSYSKGEGISGSSILLDENSNHRFVGTNWVQFDARTSKNHLKNHLESHKRVLNNYWCFPVFIENRIRYVIRIVNRITKNKSPTTWKYEELIGFGFEIRCLETVLNSIKGSGLPFRNSAMSPVLWSQIMGILDHVKPGGRIERTIFNSIHYLMRIANCHVEGQKLSISIGLANNPDYGRMNSIISINDIIMPVSLENINTDSPDQRKSVCVFNADTVVHVFDFDGKLSRVQRVSKEASPTKTFQAVTGSQDVNMLFQVRKSGVIRFFGYGKFYGDMYVSETTGLWQLRDLSTFVQNLTKILTGEIDHAVLTCLANLSFELSELKKGAILVMSTTIPNFLNDQVDVSSMNKYIDRDEDYEFISSCCGVDGAVVFDAKGCMVHYGVNLPTKKTQNKPEYGMRHNAALAASMANNGVVIAISENGGISCFIDGKAIVYKDVHLN